MSSDFRKSFEKDLYLNRILMRLILFSSLLIICLIGSNHKNGTRLKCNEEHFDYR